MNSPVEERLRAALAEAGATVDTGTLRPLRAPERRRFRVDFRLVAVAAVVVLAGAATAVGLSGGPGDEDRAVATNPEPSQIDKTKLTVFLCTRSTSKSPPTCQGRGITLEEVKAVERKLKGLPQVEELQFVDQAAAYDEFRRAFAHNKTLLQEVEIADLPESFRVKVKQGADYRRVIASLRGVNGIQSFADAGTFASAARVAEQAMETQVSVFLCDEGSALPACGAVRVPRGKDRFDIEKEGKATTDAEKAAIREVIDALPGVESYRFEDRATAYKNFQHDFSDNKKLLAAAKVDDMPESFWLKLKKEADQVEIVGELRRQPGVGMVVFTPCLVDRMTLSNRFGLSLPESKVCPIGK